MRSGTLFHDLKAVLHTEEPAHVGPEPRSGTLPIPELDQRLDTGLRDLRLTPAINDLIRSLVYLWHDHLDAAHRLAQAIENPDGSFIHGIMHRREPDYSNAKYWFRRVGTHPAFLAIAHRTGELLEKRSETDLHSRLVPNKMWDPFAFVDAVEDAAEGRFRSKVRTLEEIQRIEFECLLENMVHRLQPLPTKTE
jgi:hypothetical protein